jgi:hypothetical protein
LLLPGSFHRDDDGWRSPAPAVTDAQDCRSRPRGLRAVQRVAGRADHAAESPCWSVSQLAASIRAVTPVSTGTYERPSPIVGIGRVGHDALINRRLTKRQ